MTQFQALRPHLTLNGEAARYEAIARELNLSEGAVRIALYRLRQRFGDALRAELAETLAEPTPRPSRPNWRRCWRRQGVRNTDDGLRLIQVRETP